MIYNYRNWPFNWFGLWKEYGMEYNNYPSIYDFINLDISSIYDKDKLIQYLNKGIIIASTSQSNFISPFDGKIKTGTLSFRTDGKWLWLDNIVDHIQYYNLIMPEKWYLEIVNSFYSFPKVNEDQLKDIKWPSL